MTIDPANNGVVADTENPATIYARLESDRSPFLDRARENAKFTIPSLMPPDGKAPGARLEAPFQSIGSHGVNTLTAKLLMTVLPANSPMFRFSITDQVVEELTQDPAMRSEVEKKLNQIERAVQTEIEGLGIRAALSEAIKQLIVSGNVLLYLPRKGNLKVFRLDRYVVQRDAEGNTLRVIIKETVSREVLPQSVRDMIQTRSDLPSEDTDLNTTNGEVDVYTSFWLDGNRIRTVQHVLGMEVPRSKGSWKADKSPVMALRWTYLHDEDYGRSYIDEYMGDLTAVEGLSKAIREGAAIASKINPMVNPAGLTRSQDIAKARNMEVISGRADDVSMLQFDKQGDLGFAHQVLNEIIQRLSHAFMMNQSVQRAGERVTAEEIRTMISDIDDILGGVYSLLAQDLQLPLVLRIMDRMEQDKLIPKVSSIRGEDGKPVASPKVVTGIEALGRGHDYTKYMTAARDVILPFKEELAADLNIRDFAERALVSLSIDTNGLFKTEEQKQQEAQQMQQMQQQGMMAQMLQDGVKGAAGPMGKVMAEGMAAQSEEMPDG